MSQEKVDKYKKEKANRKQIMRREKMANLLRKCVVGIVGLILVGWIGYSAYGTYESSKPKEEVQIDYTAVNELQDRLATVQEEEAAAQEAE
mgnify:CR=1 FL=1